jgi:guanylate kinase
LNNKIIIVTAPSGSGKSTLVKYLMQEMPELAFSISAATREPRTGEVNGEHYYFMSVTEFEKIIETNGFLEWEKVYEGKYYGTLKSEMDRIWAKNQVPILDIDVLGALNIQEKTNANVCSIFIKAPSKEALEARLVGRGTETEASLKERIEKAEEETSVAHQFNHIVVNDKLEKAQQDIMHIVQEYLKN